MKTFVSSKNRYLNAIMWVIAFGLTVILFIKKPKVEEPSIYIFNAIMIGIVATIIWILLDTKYCIKEEIIVFNSGDLFEGELTLTRLEK